ncbi:unnamed protein product, partial [marine sediment metagenome]
ATDPNNPIIAGSMSEIADAQGLAQIMNQTLPYFIALVFLFIGLFASLTFAPKGADAIIKGGQRGINKASTIAGKKYWAGTAKLAGRTAATLPRSFAKGVKTGGGWKTRRGWASGFRRAGKTLTPPSPKQWAPLAKGYAKYRIKPTTKAAGEGLKKAAREVWGATIGKKPRTKHCPRCRTADIPVAQTICPTCGYNFPARWSTTGPPPSPSPPQAPRTPPTTPSPSTSPRVEELKKRGRRLKKEKDERMEQRRQ